MENERQTVTLIDKNYQMVKDYQNGNELALEKLVFSNMGFINKVANNYFRTIVDKKVYEYDDVMNSCVIGFIEAVKVYDTSKNFKAKFTTFAFYYMRMEILNEIYGHSQKEKGNSKLNQNATSIYVPVKGTDDSLTIEDTIEDSASRYCFDDVDERIYLEQLRREVKQAFKDNLTLLEEQIIRLKYGFEGKELTLEEISDMTEIKFKEVRSIESKSIRKLRVSKWGRKYVEENLKNKGHGYSYNYANIKMDIERELG